MTQTSPPVEPPKQQKRRSVGKLLLLLFRIGLIPPVLAAVFVVIPGPLQDTKTVVVQHGSSVYDIAALLDSKGVTYNPVIFRLASKIFAKDSLKAGEYQFAPRASILGVVRQLQEGRSVVRLVTVPEGLTSAEIVGLLNDIPLSGVVDASVAEGSLLPESYRYIYGDSRNGMIARMQKAMRDTLENLWAKRDPNVPIKTPAEALIMASIIEKETSKPEERARVAGVFYNRLKNSMRLQSDPTVIYGLTQGKGPLERGLARNDLTTVTPYNTYTNDGLPPGPICNPGRASIEAALHPETHDFLYFVADGTGGHVFAKELSEHNLNVVKWTKFRAQENAGQGVQPVVR
ncbi:MAG: endolytic transglycosylase MltG [Bdellovibrionales bacterium]